MSAGPILPYLEFELRERWQADIQGRRHAVPQPQILLGGDAEQSRVNMQAQDTLIVTRGGPESYTARSVGWTEKRGQYLATLDLRTPEGRVRLEGGRDDQNNPERYGGLAGECERILDALRTGDQEFDWIDGYEFRDLSEEVGYGFWRGAWEIRLTEIARTIDPST